MPFQLPPLLEDLCNRGVPRLNEGVLSAARDSEVLTSFFRHAILTARDPQHVLDVYTTNSTVTQGITSRTPSSPPYSDHYFDVIRHVHSPSYSYSFYDQSS